MPKQCPLRKFSSKTENLEGNIKLAILFVAIIAVWMLSGLFTADEKVEQKSTEKALKTVETLEVKPETYTRYLEITGTTEPFQLVNLAARTESQVQEILKDRGEHVQKGDVLLTLDAEQRKETLEAAKLDLKKAEALYNAASKLNQQGYRADTSLDTRRAELAIAKEVLKRAENDLSYTQIKSPIDGVVEDRSVEVGDYAKKGETLYTLVSRDIYKIITHVSQKDHDHISLNETAYANLSNGMEVSGTITFVASNADTITRTYKVEIEIQSDKQIPTGMSARVRIPTQTMTAYLVPYASMLLDDTGHLGAVILDNSNTTHFVEVNPLDDNGNGVYLTGFNSEKINVIVRGQNGVVEGETVKSKTVKEAPQKSKAF